MTEIRIHAAGVSVVVEGGFVYTGDLVVGADGIHSLVRSVMWRLAEATQSGIVTPLEKKGVYGILAVFILQRLMQKNNSFHSRIRVHLWNI